VLLTLGYFYWRPASAVAPADAIQFEIAQPTDSTITPFVRVSPDGSKVAFIARAAAGPAQLWVRPLQSLSAKAIEGTENPQGIAFWTEDSRFLVFTSQGKLRKIEVSGGPAQYLADVATVVGGFSTRDGQVIYSTPGTGVSKLPAAGGMPTPLGDTPLLRAGYYPSPLPNGKEFLFVVAVSPDPKVEAGIYIASLTSGEARRILPDVSRAIYAASPDPKLGYILFIRGTSNVSATLMAQPVDSQRFMPAGDAVPIAENVPLQGFSASNTGVLVHGTGGDAIPIGVPGMVQGRMNWLDRNGKTVSIFGDSNVYRIPAISPNGKFVAVEAYNAQGAHLEMYDVDRQIATQFTFERTAYDPVWSPNSDRLTYATQSLNSGLAWYAKNADRSGEAELLLNLPKPATPHNWSPDGKFLLGNDTFVPADIYSLDLTARAAERKLIPIVHSPQANEVHPRFSPDGKWFAYVSNESGTEEIYVRPWDDKAGQLGVGGVTRVSKNGARGGGAMWKRDGKELYYLAPDGTMMAVEVSTGTTFSVGTARPLFKLNAPNLFFFDVTADGKQFVMPLPDKPVAMMAPFKVVLNWTSTLKK
jgi:Tol biopolymer transport system component